MSCVEFTVNGNKCTVDTRVPRDTSLNAYLRYHLSLPGTKSMCHQGACGACVVAARAFNYTTGRIETISINSCLVLVFSCHGWDIITIEGLGNKDMGYHDIQTRTAASNGTQCGYCTCGWEMQLYSLLDKKLTMAEMEDSFGGNTCRCTGYRPIMDTVKSFAIDASPELCDKIKDVEDLHFCKTIKRNCERKASNIDEGDWSVINASSISPEGSNDIILDFGTNKYFKVYSEAQIFRIFTKYGIDSYMLMDGNTARAIFGIYDLPSKIIDIRDVPSLKRHKFDQNLVLGANMSLQNCITLFKDIAKSHSEFAYLNEFAKHLLVVANVPIRTNGTLAGNMMIKHKRPNFQSDIFVIFATVGATMTIRDMFGKKKELSMEEFLKYDMTGVLITKFELPPFGPSHRFRSYKISFRSQNASAIVNAGFMLQLNSRSIIESASIVYGNISQSFIHAVRTEAYLVGKNIFNNAVLQGAIMILEAEVVPAFEAGKPSPECRKKIAIGLFYKFILSICPDGFASPFIRSGALMLERPVSCGKQDFQKDPSLYPLNQPLPKCEGLTQSSGEAHFANDLPPMKKEVFGAFVLSTIHKGELDCIDASEVLKKDGVLAVYTAEDFPGPNSFTYPGFALQIEEEEIVASKKILYYGQPVAILVAISEALAAKAAREVKVTYKNVSNAPPVLTIDEAKKDSTRLIPSDFKIEPTSRGNAITKVIKGVYQVGGQYHYYMEPLTCVVVPMDCGLEVYDSTQWPDLTQLTVSRCLKMKESEVTVKVSRLGGGFGGKVNRGAQVATACALVAKKMNRPCRIILPMSTNMAIGGRRLPSQWEYEVGVDNNGEIQYLDVSMIENKGCSTNDNVLSYAIGGFPNCYKKERIRLKTALVLTDLSSGTLARGPGTTEGIATIEHIMEHIAFALKKDPTDVRLANMRAEDNDIPELIETLKKKSDYERRYNEIQQFNKANRWVKKAIKINVMVFPVAFFGNFTTMVSIYKWDGSVSVTTGAIEMGQGVNTKVRQVVAYELGISVDLVRVLASFSFVSTNNIVTGNSISSESACYSAIKACKTLKNRLKPIEDTLENPTWFEIVKKAGDLQVDLVAEYMMKDTEPDLASYDAFAVSILEGQLDVPTGKYMLNRLDIIEDVGLSTNPNIDIGQVEGGYVQGLSYFTTEELNFNENGKLLSDGAMSYFIYTAKDIPVEMNVSLRYNSKNPKGVLGSKAVGEMGICSAHGVTHVLRQCIMESRKDSGYDPHEWININIPYTTESILKALAVKPSEFVFN